MRRVVGIPLVQVEAMEDLIITVILIQVSIAVPHQFSDPSVTPSFPCGDFHGKSTHFWKLCFHRQAPAITWPNKPLTDAILALMRASVERHVENCYFGPIKH